MLLHRLSASAILFTCVAAEAEQVPSSTITVPISMPLGDVQAIANRELPEVLHQNSYGRTCVEPEKACTKVPEFRGFEVTMKNRCVEVTPRIDCSINELVRREGPMNVSGSASTLSVNQSIYGSATLRGRGEIGRHIRQTVRTRAEVTATVEIGVTPDWKPILRPDITYSWIERPEFRLFNLFPITLGSTLGPPLDRAIQDFEANTLPAMLADVDLRAEAEAMWDAIQEPIPFDMPGEQQAFLHLRPIRVGLDGPQFEGGQLTATLNLILQAQVADIREGQPKTSLPNLSDVPTDRTSLVVPVRLSTETINAMIAAKLPLTEEIEEPITGSIRIMEARVSVDQDRLVLDARVEGSADRLGELPAWLRVTALPSIDTEAKEVVFEDVDVSVPGSGLVAFLKNAAVTAFTLFFEDTVRVAFAEHLSEIERSLNAALNRPLGPGLRLSGSGALDVRDVRLLKTSDAIEVQIESVGAVRVTGFDPLR